MGRIGRWLLSKIETYIEGVIETRINEALKCLLYGASGDDSPPLPEDRVLIIEKTGSGSYAVCGILSVSQGANPGEKILYSRDSNGTIKSTIKLLSTGILELNGNSDFAVAFNDLKIGFDQLKSDYNLHSHATAATGPPVPPSIISTASIDASKVSGVKLP